MHLLSNTVAKPARFPAERIHEFRPLPKDYVTRVITLSIQLPTLLGISMDLPVRSAVLKTIETHRAIPDSFQRILSDSFINVCITFATFDSFITEIDNFYMKKKTEKKTISRFVCNIFQNKSFQRESRFSITIAP